MYVSQLRSCNSSLPVSTAVYLKRNEYQVVRTVQGSMFQLKIVNL